VSQKGGGGVELETDSQRGGRSVSTKGGSNIFEKGRTGKRGLLNNIAEY